MRQNKVIVYFPLEHKSFITPLYVLLCCIICIFCTFRVSFDTIVLWEIRHSEQLSENSHSSSIFLFPLSAVLYLSPGSQLLHLLKSCELKLADLTSLWTTLICLGCCSRLRLEGQKWNTSHYQEMHINVTMMTYGCVDYRWKMTDVSVKDTSGKDRGTVWAVRGGVGVCRWFWSEMFLLGNIFAWRINSLDLDSFLLPLGPTWFYFSIFTWGRQLVKVLLLAVYTVYSFSKYWTSLHMYILFCICYAMCRDDSVCFYAYWLSSGLWYNL